MVMSLKFKVIAVIAIALFLTIGLSTFIAMSRERPFVFLNIIILVIVAAILSLIFSKAKAALEHQKTLEGLNAQLQFRITEVEKANMTVMELSEEIKSKNIGLEKMVERHKRINEIGKTLNSVIETGELMKLTIKTTSELLHAERGTIYLKHYEKPPMTLKYQHGLGFEDFSGMPLDFKHWYKDLMQGGKPMIMRKQDAREDDSIGFNTSAIGVPLKLKGQSVGAVLFEDKLDGAHFTDDELELLLIISNHAVGAIETAWLYEKVKHNYFSTIHSLVNALEASDRYTKGHSERVRYLSLELGKHIGLEPRELEVLEHAAVLHDIGKIGIDSGVLHKEGRLTESELSIIKTHPLIGDEILGPINTLDGVRTTIIQHHERYDGRGYPHGILGENISLMARILAVVDTFDAMMTDRPYRKAFPLYKAKEELRYGTGSQFDPQIANAFLDMLEERKEDLLASAGYDLALPQ